MTARPFDFLDRIVADRRTAIAVAKAETPVNALWERAASAPAPRDFAAALRRPGIQVIGEIKRVSPAKGALNRTADPAPLATAYAANGVAAISVLTEPQHFFGSLDDLVAVRSALRAAGFDQPVLRKDFVIDPYQVVEARAAGADAVLVIVAIVDDATLATLIAETERLGMTPLVEVNNEIEAERAVAAGARVIGINNRNLRTFAVDLRTTERVRAAIPDDRIVASLSGVSSAEDVALLRGWRVDAMLIGEALMTATDPGQRAAEFVRWGAAVARAI